MLVHDTGLPLSAMLWSTDVVHGFSNGIGSIHSNNATGFSFLFSKETNVFSTIMLVLPNNF